MIHEGVLNGTELLGEMTAAMRQRRYEDSMVAFVKKYACETPRKLCVADPDEAMNYLEFWQRICKKAAALEDCGVSPGDRILARAKQRGDFLALHFASHLLGAVFIPVSRDMPQGGLSSLSAQLHAACRGLGARQSAFACGHRHHSLYDRHHWQVQGNLIDASG